jgi:glutathione S-transferase
VRTRIRWHCYYPANLQGQINSRIVPSFYGLLRATESAKQSEFMEQLQTDIRSLTLAADEQGPFFLGSTLCLVDIHFAPFAIRLSRILKPSRGWADPVPGSRWQRWLEALEDNAHIQATASSKELYNETADLLAQHSSSLC